MHIEKLTKLHPVRAFDCGVEPLNTFIHRFALQNQKRDGVQTWVGLSDHQVVGYYSLVVGSISHETAPDALSKGLSHHPIPVMILARLAVDQHYHAQGIGQGLLLDALRRTIQAADVAGIRAMLLHAKDDNAAAFYRYFEFHQFPEDPLTLYRLLKDIRGLIEG